MITAEIADDTARLRIWNPDTGQSARVEAHDLNPVDAVAYSPDGTLLATADDTSVRFWKLTQNYGATVAIPSRILSISLHVDFHVEKMIWSPDNDQLMIIGFESAELWNVHSGRPGAILRTAAGGERAAQWSPDGSQVAVATDSDTIRIWPAPTGGWASRGLARLRARLRAPAVKIPVDNGVDVVAWSPDATHLATTFLDISLLNIARREVVATFDGPADVLAWSPDGRHLAALSLEGTVTIHHLDGRMEPTSLRLAAASDLAWRGSRLAVAGAGTLTMLRLVDRPE